MAASCADQVDGHLSLGMWIGAVGGALWNYRIDSAGDGLAGIRMGENTTFVTSLSYLPGRVLWRMPAKFSVVKVLGRKYSLRCVLFITSRTKLHLSQTAWAST